MENWQEYFKNKKITIMGLGLLGRGLNLTKFLAGLDTELIVTDLKSKEELSPVIHELEAFENIKFVFGEHRTRDFEDRDLIIKAAGVPLDSPYIEVAKKNNTPVEMDASLFAKLAPAGVKVVGVTGTRGKSSVTHMIYEVLKESDKSAFIGGNVRGMATLPLLREVKEGDVVVLELDSWQLQGFGESQISPDIAVFTSFYPDHQNYYKGMDDYFEDKANIFKYQKSGDDLIIYEQVHDRVVKEDIKSDLFIVRDDNLPDLKLRIPGRHNLVNAALALAVCHALGLDDEFTKNELEKFRGVEGRLQLLTEVNGIKIYNDNNATSPEATIVGLKALGRNLTLIMGGVDKGLDMSSLIMEIGEHCSNVVLLNESGTETVKDEIEKLEVNVFYGDSLKEVVDRAMEVTKEGGVILFSPAFASFGKHFKNEYDRNDKFVKIIEEL